MKIAMQYRRRFWDEKNSIGQRVFTDTPLHRIYHFSVDQPGPRGILLTFTSGEDAKKLGRLREENRMRNSSKYLFKHMARITTILGKWNYKILE